MKRDYDMWSPLKKMMMSAQTIPGIPLMELLGDKRVLVENYNGVLTYERGKICVSVQYGTLQILGTDLEICYMSKHQLVICGEICGVIIERGCV